MSLRWLHSFAELRSSIQIQRGTGEIGADLKKKVGGGEDERGDEESFSQAEGGFVAKSRQERTRQRKKKSTRERERERKRYRCNNRMQVTR